MKFSNEVILKRKEQVKKHFWKRNKESNAV